MRGGEGGVSLGALRSRPPGIERRAGSGWKPVKGKGGEAGSDGRTFRTLQASPVEGGRGEGRDGGGPPPGDGGPWKSRWVLAGPLLSAARKAWAPGSAPHTGSL